MFYQKSIPLAKCNELDLIEITHIYGSNEFKKILKQFNIDLNMRIRIKEISNKISVINNNNQIILLTFDEASNIFGYNCNLKVTKEFELKKQIILKSSLTLAIASLFLIAICFYNFISKIDFSLNATEVTLNYGEHFDANRFIKSLNNAKLIVPYLENKLPGTYQLKYTAYNNFKEDAKYLTVNIVDEIAPTINLSTNGVSSEEFTNCHDYINSVSDNVDEHLLSKVKCSNELSFDKNNNATVMYEVADSSNNIARTYLNVTKPEKIIEVQKVVVEKPYNVYVEPNAPDTSAIFDEYH